MFMYVYMQKHTFSSFVCSAHLEKMTARKINMLGSQVSDSKYHPPFKESGFIERKVNSRAEAEKVYNKSKISCVRMEMRNK